MNKKTAILFTFAIIVATLFVSLFTAFIFVISFGLSTATAMSMYIAAIAVTILFTLAFASSRLKPSEVGTWFYLFAMSIAGYGVYLFFASVPLSLLIVVGTIVGFTIPKIVAALFFSAGLLAGIIGHIQSWFIVTKKYTVTIPNLPAHWQGKSAVLVTDTHFGHVRQNRFAQHIIKKILKLSPLFVLHGGDFYDGPAVDPTKITASWSDLVKKVPVFYTPGNHEQYGDYAAFIASITNAGITVLENKKTEYDGVQIAGITYRAKKQSDEALSAIENLALDPTKPSILINHPPTFHDSAEGAGINLMVSGHTHNGQFWPGTYMAKATYGIYSYGLKKYKNMHAITSKGVGTAGPPLRFLNSPELVVITFQ